MSGMRAPVRLTAEQEPFLAVRSLSTVYSSGDELDLHSHPWHQLLYAVSGAMTVYAGRWSWMIPPEQAVFIPARLAHSIRMWGSVDMRTLYLSPECCAGVDPTTRIVQVTPLLRELILRVIEVSALDVRKDQPFLHVLLEEISASSTAFEPLSLPLPESGQALAVAHFVQERLEEEIALDDLARQFGAGRRTLERQFRTETGMSYGMWQQKVRLLH